MPPKPTNKYYHHGAKAWIERPFKSSQIDIQHYRDMMTAQRQASRPNTYFTPDYKPPFRDESNRPKTAPQRMKPKRLFHTMVDAPKLTPVQKYKKQRTFEYNDDIRWEQSKPWYKKGDIGMISNMIIPSGLAYGAYRYMNAPKMPPPSNFKQKTTFKKKGFKSTNAVPAFMRKADTIKKVSNRARQYGYKQAKKPYVRKSAPYVKRAAKEYMTITHPNVYKYYKSTQNARKYAKRIMY